MTSAATPPAPAAWHHFTDPDAGWEIDIPDGLPTAPTIAPDGTRLFAGFRKGVQSGVAVYAIPGDGSAATREMLDQAADAIAAGLKTTVIERGSVVTRGEDCYRAVMESDEGRTEMRIFTTSSVILAALYIQGSAWDAGAADRTRFFESVVVP